MEGPATGHHPNNKMGAPRDHVLGSRSFITAPPLVLLTASRCRFGSECRHEARAPALREPTRWELATQVVVLGAFAGLSRKIREPLRHVESRTELQRAHQAAGRGARTPRGAGPGCKRRGVTAGNTHRCRRRAACRRSPFGSCPCRCPYSGAGTPAGSTSRWGPHPRKCRWTRTRWCSNRLRCSSLPGSRWRRSRRRGWGRGIGWAPCTRGPGHEGRSHPRRRPRDTHRRPRIRARSRRSCCCRSSGSRRSTRTRSAARCTWAPGSRTARWCTSPRRCRRCRSDRSADCSSPRRRSSRRSR